jgi:hypothetical protein
MSDHIIAPRDYRITNNEYPKQLVSVVDHTIVGNQELLGGIQIVGPNYTSYILVTDHKRIVEAQVRRPLCDVPRRVAYQGG